MPGTLDQRSGVFKHQADATLDQAAPVQNTYYTVLDTKYDVRIYAIYAAVAATGETLNVKITIDGQVLEDPTGQAATAGTVYMIVKKLTANAAAPAIRFTSTDSGEPFLFEGHSVKVEIRKTTNAGAGNITARVIHGKL